MKVTILEKVAELAEHDLVANVGGDERVKATFKHNQQVCVSNTNQIYWMGVWLHGNELA